MLVDCDNFFVSCEKLFQPGLNGRPIVVLSNNDGCVVSRSYEAKGMGIPMGAPYFKIEKQLRAAGGAALSSNYELYADMSRRLMGHLRNVFSSVDVYSIDEAFIDIGTAADYQKLGQQLQQSIGREIGIPVSIGIAATKTLCKIAGDKAKKQDKVAVLIRDEEIDRELAQTDVIDVWGVGRHLCRKLNFRGIFTALELKNYDLGRLRQVFGLNLERTAQELRQISCLDDHAEDETQQSIISSRSFDVEVCHYERLKAILAEFVDNACLRLREQQATARGIAVFIETNRFDRQPLYQKQILVPLEHPSALTSRFVQAMAAGLAQIFQPGRRYKRAGIMLSGVRPATDPQEDFWENRNAVDKEQKLMAAVDAINHKMGRKTLFLGSQAPGLQHYIRRNHKSPSYTTDWQALPLVS